MSIIRSLMQGLTATGRHRAVDRVPVLEAELDEWKTKLALADELIKKVCSEKSALQFSEARLAAEVETLTKANAFLEAENDELAARLTATRQDLANALAISSPAPADLCATADPFDDTVETRVTTLWAAHGLRVA